MRDFQRWAAYALVSVSALALTACASTAPQPLNPKYSTRTPDAPKGAQAGRKTNSPPAPGATGAKRGGTWKPYQVSGKWYYPAEQPDYDETGTASWYGDAFNGKPTANGEVFDMYALSAAHKTLPLPSMVEVTNLDNGRSMQLRVNDRGPFVDDRLIDLSRAAADKLGVLRPGLAHVRVRYVGPAPSGRGLPSDDLQYAAAAPLQKRSRELPPEPPPASKPAVVLIAPPEAEPVQIEVAQAYPEPAPAPMPVATGHYEIQAGAFSSRANAERAAGQLSQAGETEIREMDRNGQTLYRVFVRSLSDRAAAEDALTKVAASGYSDAVVRQIN